jgi:hypothetical protein
LQEIILKTKTSLLVLTAVKSLEGKKAAFFLKIQSDQRKLLQLLRKKA